MQKRLLHCGLHKTGSTWLQDTVFSHWPEIQYLESHGIGRLPIIAPQGVSRDTPLVYSNEGAAGYPYPITEGFTPAILEGQIRTLGITHLLLVTREFNAWCLSVYLQTLHEGATWSLESFLLKNKSLPDWRAAPERIRALCAETGVNLLEIDFSDLRRDPDAQLAALAAFLEVDGPASAPRNNVNISRYGIWAVGLLRGLNFLFRGRARKMMGNKHIVQGGFIGGPLDRLSPRRLRPEDVARILGSEG